MHIYYVPSKQDTWTVLPFVWEPEQALGCNVASSMFGAGLEDKFEIFMNMYMYMCCASPHDYFLYIIHCILSPCNPLLFLSHSHRLCDPYE